MGKQLFPPYTARLWRSLSLTDRARANAAQAVHDLAADSDRTGRSVLRRGDLLRLAGHPGGLSKVKAAARLSTALWECFPGHVALLDSAGTVVSVNRAWRQFRLANGCRATAGLGVNYVELCDRAVAAGEPEAGEVARLVRAALSGSSDYRRIAYRVESPSGRRWFRLQAIPLTGPDSGALVIREDITAEKELESDLRHRAFHDPLTGLPNRALLSDRLEHAVAGAIRDPRSLAVLFLDLDDFKCINDRFGHLAGDEVLRRVAQSLANSVRVSDTVGRWGGDEFVIIAERLDANFTVDALVGRLLDSLSKPIDVGGAFLQVNATIGVARLEDQQTADGLVEAADQALIAERTQRRGAVVHAAL